MQRQHCNRRIFGGPGGDHRSADREAIRRGRPAARGYRHRATTSAPRGRRGRLGGEGRAEESETCHSRSPSKKSPGAAAEGLRRPPPEALTRGRQWQKGNAEVRVDRRGELKPKRKLLPLQTGHDVMT